MKRVLCLVLIFAFLFCFVACSKSYNIAEETVDSLSYVGDYQMKTDFEKIFKLKDILTDIARIDVTMEMGSVSSYEKETETADDGTSIDYYYNGDDCIYEVYNGYSENLWKYYTSSVSGTPLAVSFWDEDEVPTVSIETLTLTNGYTYIVTFSGVDGELENKAKIISVEVIKGETKYKLTIDGSNYYVSEATYLDSDGNTHIYEASMEDEKISYYYDEVVTEEATTEVLETP